MEKMNKYNGHHEGKTDRKEKINQQSGRTNQKRVEAGRTSWNDGVIGKPLETKKGRGASKTGLGWVGLGWVGLGWSGLGWCARGQGLGDGG